MFNLKFFIFLAVIALGKTASVNISTSGDQAFDDAFKKMYDDFQNDVLKGEITPPASSLLKIYIQSIDAKCMKKTQELFNFTARFIELANRIDEKEEFTVAEKRDLTTIQVLTSFKCSDKLRPITETVFDLVQSFGHILRAFKDEPELAEYQKYLRYANNYAVTRNMWDVKKYPVEYELTADETEQWKNIEDQVAGVSNLIMFDEKFESLDFAMKCLRKFLPNLIDPTLRLVLSMQVKMTTEQKREQFNRFFSDTSNFYDQTIACTFKYNTEDQLERLRKIMESIEQKKLPSKDNSRKSRFEETTSSRWDY